MSLPVMATVVCDKIAKIYSNPYLKAFEVDSGHDMKRVADAVILIRPDCRIWVHLELSGECDIQAGIVIKPLPKTPINLLQGRFRLMIL